jgi:hypothetical protein
LSLEGKKESNWPDRLHPPRGIASSAAIATLRHRRGDAHPL